jgi:GNAT superfamily N-acetyltransferase
MPSLAIAKAGKDDAVTLATLCAEHACYEQLPACPVDHAQRLHALLERQEAILHAWIAWNRGEAVGYAAATIDVATLSGTRYLHLDCLYLVERWRARGIGRQLFEVVAAFARAQGVAEIQWQTPDWNHGAIRFYQGLGASMQAKQRFILRQGNSINNVNNAERQRCKIN